MFHLHLRYRSRDGGGSCEAARQYIAREGRFSRRGDKVRWVQSLHMPDWAGGDSAPRYWKAAEGLNSRVNARTAMLLEFAIPKQLPPADQDALVLEMAECLSAMGVEGDDQGLRLPVTMAVHEGHGRNPHAHGLVSLSLNDGMARNEETWFRRHAPGDPGRGGARRSDYVTKRRWLYRVRELWARLGNAALVRQGMVPALDHRSNVDRGLTKQPTIHFGPRIAQMVRQGVPTARGERSRLIEEANAATAQLDALLLRRRREMQQAERDLQACLQLEGRWRAMQQTEWGDLLSSHPLIRSPAEIKRHATVVICEADPASASSVGRALDKYSDLRAFAEAVGPGWEAVATPDGFWAIKPGHESLVLLARGYAATDGEDEDCLTAILNAAPMLGMKSPLVAMKALVSSTVQCRLNVLGRDWRQVTIDRPGREQRSQRRP